MSPFCRRFGVYHIITYINQSILLFMIHAWGCPAIPWFMSHNDIEKKYRWGSITIITFSHIIVFFLLWLVSRGVAGHPHACHINKIIDWLIDIDMTWNKFKGGIESSVQTTCGDRDVCDLTSCSIPLWAGDLLNYARRLRGASFIGSNFFGGPSGTKPHPPAINGRTYKPHPKKLLTSPMFTPTNLIVMQA